MAKKQNQSESEVSLISSSTLPEFSDIEALYEAEFQAIENEEKSAVKPKKSRKKKGDTEPSQAQEVAIDNGEAIQVTGDDIEDWTAFPLDMLFSRMDKKPLGKIERKAWARSCATVINKYAPAVAGKYGAEIGLIICGATIFATRMQAPEASSVLDAGDKQAKDLSEK